MRLSNLLAAAAVLVLSSAAAARADIIAGLYNTGVDANGVRLVNGGQADPHYTLVETGQAPVTYYNGAWQGANPNAGWISVRTDGRSVPPRTYRTTFDLTGYDPSSVVLDGAWGVDNFGYIYLNGGYTGVALDGNGGGNFLTFHNFTLDSGFVAGVNVLDFFVIDVGEITGLAVQDLALRGDVASSGAPEPAGWAMLIGGLGAMGSLLRRRRAALA
jgi:hypothetical protein